MRQTDGVESVVVTLTSALWGRIWASSHRLTFSDKALGAASMAASGSTPRHHLCPCIRSSHASPIFSVPFFAAKEGRKEARLRSFVRSFVRHDGNSSGPAIFLRAVTSAPLAGAHAFVPVFLIREVIWCC